MNAQLGIYMSKPFLSTCVIVAAIATIGPGSDYVYAKEAKADAGKNNQVSKRHGDEKKEEITISTSIEYGRALYKAYDCASCHQLEGKGAKEGVALDNLRRSKSFMIGHMLDPEKHVQKFPKAYNNEPNLMPSHQLSRDEASALADYLRMVIKKNSAKQTK